VLLTLTIGTSSSSISISTYVGASDGLGHIHIIHPSEVEIPIEEEEVPIVKVSNTI